MNIKITKDCLFGVLQLITEVEGVDKMRNAFNIKLKEGDIVPDYFFNYSIATTGSIEIVDDLDKTINTVEILKDGEGKIIYETRNIDWKLFGKQSVWPVSVELPEFEYIDL